MTTPKKCFTKLLILFLLCSFSGYTQKVKFNKGRPEHKGYFTEITYKELKSKLIIPVIIQDKTYQFLFDTGAPNLISHTLKKEIQTRELNTIRVKDANDSGRPLNVVTIPALEIGGVVFKNSPAIVNDPDSNFLFDCLGIDGIIGSNLLRNSIVQIDSSKKQIIITDQLNRLVLEGKDFLDMTLSSGQSSPYIWIQLRGAGKASEQVLFDTGSQGFYDLSGSSFEVLDNLNVFGSVESALGYKGLGLFGVSKPMVHYRVLIPELTILGTSFLNVISISTGASKSRIGADLLAHGKVTLDFQNKKFFLEGFEQEVDLREEVWAFSPTAKDSSLVVGIIWDKDLAKKARFGDAILMINDLETEEIDICDLLIQESLFEKNRKLQVVFRDSTGVTQSVELRKEFLKIHTSAKK